MIPFQRLNGYGRDRDSISCDRLRYSPGFEDGKFGDNPRARDGGLRMGEMEIECTWAHGTMQFLKERIIECSDNYRIHACKQCGFMAIVNPDKNIYYCRNCKNNTNFSEIRIPYACKLLFQEIATMNLGTRLLTA